MEKFSSAKRAEPVEHRKRLEEWFNVTFAKSKLTRNCIINVRTALLLTALLTLLNEKMIFVQKQF